MNVRLHAVPEPDAEPDDADYIDHLEDVLLEAAWHVACLKDDALAETLPDLYAAEKGLDKNDPCFHDPVAHPALEPIYTAADSATMDRCARAAVHGLMMAAELRCIYANSQRALGLHDELVPLAWGMLHAAFAAALPNWPHHQWTHDVMERPPECAGQETLDGLALANDDD